MRGRSVAWTRARFCGRAARPTRDRGTCTSGVEQPVQRLQVLLEEVAADRPGDRLADRPKPRPLPVETELGGEAIEPPNGLPPGVTELERANDRRDRELALTDERLRVDGQPALALGSEDVSTVKVLVEQHLLALGRGERRHGVERDVEQATLERSPRLLPLLFEVAEPPFDLGGERTERLLAADPEPWQQADQHVERGVRVHARE